MEPTRTTNIQEDASRRSVGGKVNRNSFHAVTASCGTLDRVLGGAIAAARGEGASSNRFYGQRFDEGALAKALLLSEIKKEEKTGGWIKKVDLQ